MKIPSLTALRAFEAVARNLSFSKAANELFVTHAAMSHQVKALETWFGRELFIRRGRRIELTDIGETLSSQISLAFTDLATACSRAKAANGEQSLVVGCIPSIASRWLVPNIHLFAKLHPTVDLRVLYASPNERLNDGELDILITFGEDNSRDVNARRLFSRMSKAVCSPGFLQIYGPLHGNQDIARLPRLHDEDTKAWEEWTARAGLERREPANSIAFQDFNLLATAVIAGHGVALCPVEVFRVEIERGDLIVLSDISIGSQSAYYAMSRRGGTDIAAAFIEWFSDDICKTSR